MQLLLILDADASVIITTRVAVAVVVGVTFAVFIDAGSAAVRRSRCRCFDVRSAVVVLLNLADNFANIDALVCVFLVLPILNTLVVAASTSIVSSGIFYIATANDSATFSALLLK